MQWLMLQQNQPEDFVIATGRMETVRKFIEITAEKLGWYSKELKCSIIWEGSGLNEVGKRADNGEIIIKIDERYFRPTEVEELKGDPAKALRKLGWKPNCSLEKLIEEMVDNDIREAKKEFLLNKEGFNVNVPLEFPPSN